MSNERVSSLSERNIPLTVDNSKKTNPYPHKNIRYENMTCRQNIRLIMGEETQ